MSNMSKKKIIAMMALVIVIAILGTGTLAYFTTRVVTHNVITSGGVNIQLVETQDLDNNPATAETPYPTENLSGIMPGQKVSKIVRVQNLDANAWVRAKVVITVKDSNGNVLPEGVVTVNTNNDNWIPNGDWYYYKDYVPAGGKTEVPLFTQVTFADVDMDNRYQNATVEISVDAEAIQYANNEEFATAWPAGVVIEDAKR